MKLRTAPYLKSSSAPKFTKIRRPVASVEGNFWGKRDRRASFASRLLLAEPYQRDIVSLGALMSSWAEVDLTTVTTDNSVLPENQDFEFELLPGARFSKYDPDRVEAAAKVANGEFAGRIKYFSYPDPNKVGEWVRGVFIRMTHALGSEIEPGESPVDYLNRMAGAHFVTKMKHRMVEVDGVSTTKDDIKIGNVKAVRTAE
ncbi:unnamed protein product [Sphagnum jensenii]